MFTLWITSVYPYIYIHTHYVNKPLGNEKQYHFFVELNKLTVIVKILEVAFIKILNNYRGSAVQDIRTPLGRFKLI